MASVRRLIARLKTAWIALLLIGLVSGCGRPVSSEKLEGQVRFGVYQGDTAALVWIAQELGMFERAGLDVTLLSYSAGKLAADALVRQEVDVATSTGFVFVKNSFREPDLRVLGSIATATTNWVIGNRDAGITQPQDLKGKKVGVTLGSSGEYYLGLLLSASNLGFGDITLVDMSPPALVEAMRAGKVDAVCTWHPNVHVIQNSLGAKAVSFDSQQGQNFYFLLLGRNSWLTDHPLHARRLIQALHQAEVWVKQNAAEAKSIVGRRFDLEADYLDKMWRLQDLELTFPQALVVVLDAEKRWLRKQGLVDNRLNPDFSEYIYPDALAEVNPAAVTVIR